MRTFFEIVNTISSFTTVLIIMLIIRKIIEAKTNEKAITFKDKSLKVFIIILTITIIITITSLVYLGFIN